MTLLIDNVQSFAIFESLVEEIVEHAAATNVASEVVEHIRASFLFNSNSKELFRVLVLPEVGRIMLNRDLSDEEFRHLSILGWLVTMFQAYLEVADDIRTGSSTHLGRKCWYLQPNVGMMAINDAALLKTGIFVLIKKHFGAHPCYIEMMESFHETSRLVEMGHASDAISRSPETWSRERYDQVTTLKCGYSGFYLSVLLALYFLNLATPLNIQQTKDILIPLGKFEQAQNDFMDVFGDGYQTGNVGTSILEKRCSWVVVQALSRCGEAERLLIYNNYGLNDTQAAKKVQKVFETSGLIGLFKEEKLTIFQQLKLLINNLDERQGLRRSIFDIFVNYVNDKRAVRV
ncbi:isoprenoid synthase domain-containing protein [Xylogone sp. PMI_703]|nr:isoprenoid synthase domain-containing protein [Xylogone sp. PMI_703]